MSSQQMRGNFVRLIVGALALCSTIASAAGAKPSAELARALAAAERARSTPPGQAYQEASGLVVGRVFVDGTRDCLPIVAPGVRQPRAFDSVLIIGKNGKLKWIVRDTRERLAACYFSKLTAVTFPPPPADNWPIRFSFGRNP